MWQTNPSMLTANTTQPAPCYHQRSRESRLAESCMISRSTATRFARRHPSRPRCYSSSYRFHAHLACTQTEGWWRYAFRYCGHALRLHQHATVANQGPQLQVRRDCFCASRPFLARNLNGLPMWNNAMPWKKSDHHAEPRRLDSRRHSPRLRLRTASPSETVR